MLDAVLERIARFKTDHGRPATKVTVGMNVYQSVLRELRALDWHPVEAAQVSNRVGGVDWHLAEPDAPDAIVVE